MLGAANLWKGCEHEGKLIRETSCRCMTMVMTDYPCEVILMIKPSPLTVRDTIYAAAEWENYLHVTSQLLDVRRTVNRQTLESITAERNQLGIEFVQYPNL